MIIKTEIISTHDPNAIPYAMTALETGKLVAFPTDTIYGLAALISDREGITKLYQAKGRETTKAIAVLMHAIDDLARVAIDVSPTAQALAKHFWPGPLTLIVPRHPQLPDNISPTPTLGVRVPDHPDALALMKVSGPLAVTSANLSGYQEARTAQDVFDQLEGRVAVILDGGRTPGGQASTVVDCLRPELKILRPGPLSLEDLLGAL
ncbi:MAG: threonylcarbamoyl-AMP synthase [Chloroflexi bacterium]|nr:threonylcarbamoyl-AMP synthase [Chloroflexota bacterium]